MDDRAEGPGVSFTVRRHAGELPSRSADVLSDWWQRESPTWSEHDTGDLLASFSLRLSMRLGPGLFGDEHLGG